MDSRKIAEFINKANRRLKLQHMAKTFQIALGFGLAAALLVMVISRLSIFPYYGFYAYSAAALVFAAIWLWCLRKIPRRRQAITELDQYTPHNQLLTLSQLPVGNRLADDLTAKVEKEIHFSYRLFRKDKNEWLLPKWLILSVGLAVLLMISGLFPASTQLEAKEHEQEQELIEEMIEKVEEQKEETVSPTVKKELESLEEKLRDSETPEQALREMVKKQKELNLQQQLKMQEESEQAKEEADELSDASAQLAEQAGETQTALSEMGKPVAFDLQQSLAANEPSGDVQESDDTGGESQSESAAESDDPATGESGNSTGSGEGGEAEESEPGGESEAGGKGAESAEGAGAADGAGEGEGQGEGASEEPAGGQGQGSGQGGEGAATGSGAGTGQGSRELLSIPSRIGGTGETTVDSGELSESGESSFEEGPVDVERGSVRPYQDVVGAYSDSYFSSAERMKLPPDLQTIVRQYFSSIEND